jgi:CO/xanthine dehydrogenase Mo-binding subunit
VGPACTSCGRWLSKNLTGISLPVSADIPTDIQVHFVEEFDAHASPTGARGISELGATGVAAAVANAVCDAVHIRIRDLPITPAGLVERIDIGTEGLNVRLRGYGLIGLAREMLSSDMERAA